MAQWITTDQQTTNVQLSNNGEKFSLEEMQRFVGGYIEPIALTNDLIMYVNEDGRRKHLPVNVVATTLLRSYYTRATVTIVGNVLVASKKETGDEEEEDNDKEEEDEPVSR